MRGRRQLRSTGSAAALPEPIVSMSLRTWPLDFPDDITVQRATMPSEARADAIMYRQVLAEVAHAHDWDVHLYHAEGSRRSGRPHAGRAGRPDPSRPSGTRLGAALGEGPSGRARRDDRRRLTAAMLMLRRR